ncbi:hypothetical protein CY35_07G068500 [Sphagnum magellanicum]|uniref:Uncharacterized protein n=1 Tax=Sphagnum magellanicum TaxID=128215 RepID=A0ACB8HLL9_9BRYO|nr:hypothetical protein CY35_07G068500 [Sphagnum magellanicum]
MIPEPLFSFAFLTFSSLSLSLSGARQSLISHHKKTQLRVYCPTPVLLRSSSGSDPDLLIKHLLSTGCVSLNSVCIYFSTLSLSEPKSTN